MNIYRVRIVLRDGEVYVDHTVKLEYANSLTLRTLAAHIWAERGDVPLPAGSTIHVEQTEDGND